MKKNGFTLIELLGIIVVLSIIALLLVPAVLDTIEEYRISSAEAGATLYVKNVELASSQNKITDKHLDGVYLINSEGNLCPEDDGEGCETPIIIETKGTKPSGGKVVLKDGKVKAYLEDNKSKRTTITIGKYHISYNINNEMRNGVVCWFQSGYPMTKGSKYTCNPGDQEYTFYYMGETEGIVSFIMDRNLGETGLSNVKEAQKELKNLTKNWTLVDERAVSLPTADQLANASGFSSYYSGDVLESFLCSNLLDWSDPNSRTLPRGYWTSSVNPNSSDQIYYMYTKTCKLGGSTDPQYIVTIGVRPVINSYKDQIGA